MGVAEKEGSRQHRFDVDFGPRRETRSETRTLARIEPMQAPTNKQELGRDGTSGGATKVGSGDSRPPQRRKAKPEGERRRHGVTIRFTSEERERLKKMRHIFRVPVARLVREAALQTAEAHAPARPVRARPHDPDFEHAATVLMRVENLLDEFARAGQQAKRAGVPAAQVAALLAGVEFARECCRELVPLPDGGDDLDKEAVEPPASAVIG